MRVRFLTSTPWNVARGSGTYVGISTLASALRNLGVTVEIVSPKFSLPNYTLQRVLFNRMLRLRESPAADVTVGFDMDGYSLAGQVGGVHVAAIKGVIADEMRFESGLTRATMRVQAAREKLHVQRADLVITTSEYSRRRIQELYRPATSPHIVPELIDLSAWEKLLVEHPAAAPADKFVALCVCRFYPRKRLHLLLEAASQLRSRIPGLAVRIVGNGPEASKLKTLWHRLQLENIVSWLGDVPQEQLAREYNQCHIFCLPSVQEGFGLVFLEAMASGKTIVAAHAAAVPEVVKHGVLVDADNSQALAEGIAQLHREPGLRDELSRKAREWGRAFDAPTVGRLFLAELQPTLSFRQGTER